MRKVKYKKIISALFGAGIPFKSDAFILFDGTLSDDNFLDKQTGRLLPITNKDFTVSGFPYKSKATVSPPIGDTEWIAADVNEFWYTSGVPNVISVHSFFQNIDYSNYQFCRHIPQELNASGAEISEPYIVDIVLYNTIKSGSNLNKCNSYYEAPEEQVSNVVWISPDGDDATGDGSKLNPYRSLTKIKDTTEPLVYQKTGDYSLLSTTTWTGAPTVVQGLGRCSFTLNQTAVGMTIDRDLTIKNNIISGIGSNLGILFKDNTEFNLCQLVQTGVSNNMLTSQAGTETKYLKLTNSYLDVEVSSSVLFPFVLMDLYQFDTCIGNINENGIHTINNINLLNSELSGDVIDHSSLLNIKGCKLISNIPSGIVTYSNITGNITATTVDDNILITGNIIATNISRNNITGDVLGSPLVSEDNNITGKIDITLINDMSIQNNIIEDSANNIVLDARAANGSAVTGVVVKGNNIIGEDDNSYLVYIGGANEGDNNAVNGIVFEENKVINKFIGGGICHAVFLGGGINHVFRFNRITTSNGYGLVLKAGGESYTTDEGHISYNVFETTGANNYAVYNRGAENVVCSNNVITNYEGVAVFNVDDDSSGKNNSMLVVNNLITLSGNTANLAIGINMTSRVNYINKNGFTCTEGTNNFETSVEVDIDGRPDNSINSGEDIGGKYRTGLDASTNWGDENTLPSVKYLQQQKTWDIGAYISFKEDEVDLLVDEFGEPYEDEPNSPYADKFYYVIKP